MDDQTIENIVESFAEWRKLRRTLLGDHMGFYLASGQDWEKQLNAAAEFASLLEDIAGEIKADIDRIDDRVARFLAD